MKLPQDACNMFRIISENFVDVTFCTCNIHNLLQNYYLSFNEIDNLCCDIISGESLRKGLLVFQLL